MQYLRFLSAVFFCFGLFIGSAAADSSVYTVDVSVDVTDVNASKAREKAMLAANRKAFETVVRKLTTSQGASSMLGLSDDQIVNFIKEVSVVSEKSSNVRYIANLKVTVSEQILNAYMNEKEINSVVATASKIVVIPVFREFPSDKPLLWEENNPWRQAWETAAPRNSLVKITSLPLNDVSMAEINAEKALAFDLSALQEIALNNNANDVYVADAVYDGIDGLKIRLFSIKSNNAEETISVPGDRNQSAELFARAISEVSSMIENKVKAADIAENRMINSIEVVFNFRSISEWVRAESQLKSIAYVRGLQVEAMGTGKVQFKLEFVGSDDKLWGALRDKGFNLKDYGDFYLLER